MIKYTTGDLLKSEAYALVNTVNCEGYMGKGIAYQFKLQFPDMNEEYIKECRNHKLLPGKLHCYNNGVKLIINFPTKNKWREKSKMEYISSGLDDLKNIIKKYNIKSIAIPPLGSGNGGLIWEEVKLLINKKLSDISEDVDIIIYEPSKNYKSKPVTEPDLSLPALILMKLKLSLEKEKFDMIRLQETAYFINILSDTQYFHFVKDKYGPYDHSIEVISKKIKEFEIYHGVKSTEEAYNILMQKLISQSTQDKINFYTPFIKKASDFSNNFTSSEEIEGAGTALFIIEQNQPVDTDNIVKLFNSWSEDKAKRFSETAIKHSIDEIEKAGFVEKTLCGYHIST